MTDLLINYFVLSMTGVLFAFIILARLIDKFGKDNWGMKALIVVFVIADWLLNWTTATVLWLQFPKTPLELVTDRLKRYKADYANTTDNNMIEWWRLKGAVFFCRILSANDEGHC